MGYLVETSGRLLLPQELERQAVTVLEVRMGPKSGWFDPDRDHVDTVAELAEFAATSAHREGEWLVLSTGTEGDPKWTEQASEFYRSLGAFVRDGEVHVRGQDDQVWSYLYSADGVVQRGANGWDGTPGDAPVDTAPAPAQAPAPPPAPLPGATARPSEPSEPSEFRYPGSEDRPAAPEPAQPPPAPLPYAGGSDAPPAQDAPLGPDERVQRAWADPPPASAGRSALMVGLLVVGVVLIIGLALLVSGL